MCNFGCVARSVDLLKSNVANILLFNFCEQKFFQHGPITIAIDWNGFSWLIFDKWPNYSSGPKSAPNSWLVRWLLNVCLRVFPVPQMRQFCLFTYQPRSKWASAEKKIFFAKIGIFGKSRAGPFPSLVQAYAHTYSCDGRIKLITCQIRHELSVTTHEISICSRKENVSWWTLYLSLYVFSCILLDPNEWQGSVWK